MQRNVKVGGGRVACQLREGLIDLIVVVCKAVVWLYRFLAALPVPKLRCLTNAVTCFIFIVHCFNPYLNVLLFLMLAQNVIGFAAPDEPSRQWSGGSRGRRCDRRL